jgi:hypothetical protein
MTAADVHLGTGAMALDALPLDEAEEFRIHLMECEFCPAEMAGFLETTALLAAAEAEQPPASLRERVLAAARNTPQLPPLVTAEPGVEPPAVPAPPAPPIVPPQPPTRHRSAQESRRRWFARPVSWLVAAVIVAVGAGGAVWWATSGRSPQQSAAECLATAADVSVLPPQSGSGDVRWSPSCGAASVAATGLAQLPSGQVYQLWVLHGTSTVARSAGILSATGGSGSAIATIGAGDTTLAMTVEPGPSGSAQPTTTPFWVATL